MLAVADCIEDVRQAEPAELAELTAQWKMLVRAKFRKAVAALNEPGAVVGAGRGRGARSALRRRRAPPPKPSGGDDDEDNDDDDEAPPPPTGGAPPTDGADDDDDDERRRRGAGRRSSRVGLGRRAARRHRDAPRRRHGGRGFAMQKDAAKAFGVSQGDVSLLVNHPTKCPARLRHLEARRPVDSDAEEEGRGLPRKRRRRQMGGSKSRLRDPPRRR